jgi:hypothetical protein
MVFPPLCRKVKLKIEFLAPQFPAKSQTCKAAKLHEAIPQAKGRTPDAVTVTTEQFDYTRTAIAKDSTGLGVVWYTGSLSFTL